MTQEDRYDRTARVPDRGRPALGGAATAVVTALAAIVMVLLAHGLFEVPVLAAHGMSAWESVDATAYALGSEVVALAATALLHLLLISTPRAKSFSSGSCFCSP